MLFLPLFSLLALPLHVELHVIGILILIALLQYDTVQRLGLQLERTRQERDAVASAATTAHAACEDAYVQRDAARAAAVAAEGDRDAAVADRDALRQASQEAGEAAMRAREELAVERAAAVTAVTEKQAALEQLLRATAQRVREDPSRLSYVSHTLNSLVPRIHPHGCFVRGGPACMTPLCLCLPSPRRMSWRSACKQMQPSSKAFAPRCLLQAKRK